MTFSNHNIRAVPLNKESIQQELKYKTSRSSGSGGQHVNKVSTKVELVFDLEGSITLTADEKVRLSKVYANRLTRQGVLSLTCDKTRSQFRNKTMVQQRFFDLLETGLRVQKQRKPTRIPKMIKERRLDSKRQRATTKQNRRKPQIE